MTKSELRKARKEAHTNGVRLEGVLAIPGQVVHAPIKPVRRYTRTRYASKAEQHARYLDCGPQAWDDRDSPSGDY